MKAVKFPKKQMQILGSHLSSKALAEREQQMQQFIERCMGSEEVRKLPETQKFLIYQPVNVRYEI